jgi:dTDP-4-dehydrorhamnose 3,5-epimerase
MIFTPTELAGAMIVGLQPAGDARGYFARVYCEREFSAHGLPRLSAQANVSMTRRTGTLRGMHFQVWPNEEDKLVRCVHGAIWDVIVDIRAGSPTYCRWLGVELSESNQRMLLVPKGFAHGFQTLSDDVVVSYMMSEFYEPTAARGARYDDAAFGIRWPLPVTEISEKDRNWPSFARSDSADAAALPGIGDPSGAGAAASASRSVGQRSS